jgi:hypothetical protein
MPEALLWATGSGSAGVSFTDALRGVLAAFVFGQVLAFAYERTYTGVSYARGFAHTIVLTSLAASTFVMAIGRSLYAGLGLLGVLSIIRFRANLKAPRDLVFLLGAASTGVACGIDALPVAVVGTVAFALVAVYLHYSSFASQREYDGVLRFSIGADDERESRLPALLATHCARSTALERGRDRPGRRGGVHLPDQAQGRGSGAADGRSAHRAGRARRASAAGGGEP